MRNGAIAGGALSADALGALRGTASRDPKAAVREAARQFESLFMQELMKSMRASVPSSGLADNAGTGMGTEMLDQQYAMQLSGRPGGLADMIARQLERQLGAASRPDAAGSVPAAPRAATPVPAGRERAAAFVQRHAADARAAAADTGIPADFILAQAAHETGWGRREIRDAAGRNSHNLFGIKAGPGWKGPVAEITTTEVVNGVAHKVKAKFRAYESYEAAFRDWARLLKDSPRYAGVLKTGGDAQAFAQGLQRAGYATDPAYARKLAGVISTTQRLQRGGWA